MSDNNSRIDNNAVPADTNAEEALEAFLIQHVPLAKAAGLKVGSYDSHHLSLSAPLSLNINDKGTAFGGSLYVLCVSAGWGMTYLKAKELGLEGDLVIAKAEIEYLKPLKGDLQATASCPKDAELHRFSRHFQSRGKAVLMVDVRIVDEFGEVCAQFHGKYAILKS